MGKLIYTLFCIFTAIVGYAIHHSIFYAIINFIFAPIAWVYWLICQDVNLTVIQNAFSFFLK